MSKVTKISFLPFSKVETDNLNNIMDLNYFKQNSSRVFLDIIKDIVLLNEQNRKR